MYSRKYVDIITLAIVTIILILVNVYQFQTQNNIEKVLEQSKNLSIQTNIQEPEIIEEKVKQNNIENIKTTNEAYLKEADVATPHPDNWSISIPVIDLVAPIQDGTTEEILNTVVGHFEESAITNGNVCLAAHNRGYDVNYFENIKKLLLNDIIIYKYDNFEKQYAVSNITIIKDTDWSYIENSNENKITLITCIEDEPEYRLCVQATEIKK